MVEHLSHEYGSAEAAVLHLMALANIDMDDLKDYKKKLRSFSNATYSKIAPLFNLSPTVIPSHDCSPCLIASVRATGLVFTWPQSPQPIWSSLKPR
jgi:hypothetical protein